MGRIFERAFLVKEPERVWVVCEGHQTRGYQGLPLSTIQRYLTE